MSLPIIQNPRYSFYRCLNCGLIRLHPFPKKQTQKKLYKFTNADKHNQQTNSQLALLYKFSFGKKLLDYYRLQIFRHRRKVVEHFISKGKLLDVGCAQGEFLLQLNSSSWQLYGVEINPHQVKSVKVNIPYLTLHAGTIETYRPRQKFDVITLWHVFEHLTDPESVINKLFRILKPGGWLFIEIPQGNALWRKIFGHNWQLLLVPEHLYFWTDKSLTQFLKQRGFTIKQVEFCGFISSFVGSLANRLRSKNTPSVIAVVIALLLSPISMTIHLLYPASRDNLLIIARKPSPD